MRVKIHSSEVNRMLKTVMPCVDTRGLAVGNIELACEDNMFLIRGGGFSMRAMAGTPVMGTDDERFCVDGTVFQKICALCGGEIEIITDGKVCTVKGNGRTRIPIVEANAVDIAPIEGNTVSVKGEDLIKAYRSVGYAISQDESRPVLTGVLAESDGRTLKFVALDGFQMSMEEVDCEGATMKVVIPGAFLKLTAGSVTAGETVEFTTDGHTIQAETDSMRLKGGLLIGEYVDYGRILPKEHKTQCMVRTENMRMALKSGTAVNSKQSLVKLDVGQSVVKVMSNSEAADFEADVDCQTNGDGLQIAFNEKYLMNTMNSVEDENAVMLFNSAVSPMIVRTEDGHGTRLVLPVRVAR